MNARPVLISLGLVTLGVLVQTTLFGDGRIQPLGSSPLLVTVIVIACVRYLDPEPALLLGFTAGLLLDLLGGSPLGLWAMVNTVVAYLALRFRGRADDGPQVIAAGVFLLTLLAQVLFLLVGSLFGQRLSASDGIVKLVILPAAYSVVVAAAVIPLATWLLRDRSVRTWRP